MSKYDKQRLIEVMQRLDKTFKPRLAENIHNTPQMGGILNSKGTAGYNPDTSKQDKEYAAMNKKTNDPTKEEMASLLQNKFQGMADENIEFDIAAAIYWFASDYHGGQNSNLYSALSTSDYRPSPMHSSIEDDESETATQMYQELINTFGGAQEHSVDEVFGWSAKEKETKGNNEKIEAAKQEIQKYNFNRIFFMPAKNADANDLKQSKVVRINGITQELPLLAELLPQLFDVNQGASSIRMKSGANEYEGMIPLNWANILRGTDGYINQDQAVQRLNQELDGFSQKMGMQEQQEEEFVPHDSYTVSNSGGYEIMLSDDGDAAKVRDAFGSDNPETSDWLEIVYVSGKPVIDPSGYNIPLSHVMRIR